MQPVGIWAIGSALAMVAGLGCGPTELVVRQPLVDRVLLVPSGGLGRSDDRYGGEELRDVYGPSQRHGSGRALTADTDPTRLEEGTVSSTAGAGTFACAIPGAPGGWCARAVSGPFVVTDLRTAKGCGEHALVAAVAGKIAEAPRWAMKGAVDAHGSRLLIRSDEWLLVGGAPVANEPVAAPTFGKRRAEAVAPPPAAPCVILWGGFRPYEEEQHGRAVAQGRPVDRVLDVPATRPDVLDPTPPLGKPARPRVLFDRLDTTAPAAPLPGGPMDPGF